MFNNKRIKVLEAKIKTLQRARIIELIEIGNMFYKLEKEQLKKNRDLLEISEKLTEAIEKLKKKIPKYL